MADVDFCAVVTAPRRPRLPLVPRRLSADLLSDGVPVNTTKSPYPPYPGAFYYHRQPAECRARTKTSALKILQSTKKLYAFFIRRRVSFSRRFEDARTTFGVFLTGVVVVSCTYLRTRVVRTSRPRRGVSISSPSRGTSRRVGDAVKSLTASLPVSRFA